MKINKQTLDSLADWFASKLNKIDQYQSLREISELLLCASDLDIDTPRIQQVIEKIKDEEPPIQSQKNELLDALRRQLIFYRFQTNIASRKVFLNYWFSEKNYQGNNIVTISFLVNLALCQQELLTEEAKEYVRNWFLRHNEIKALSVRGWIPYCLKLADQKQMAVEVARSVMNEVEQDGSWTHDLRRTLQVAYPLALSKTIPSSEFNRTIEYVSKRYINGFAEELTIKTKIIKLYRAFDLIPEGIIDKIIARSSRTLRVFLCHSSEDKPAVSNLCHRLRTSNIDPWLDKEKLLPGQDWDLEIKKAIRESDVVIVCLSRSSISKEGYVQKEIVSALDIADEKPEGTIFIIPLKLEECQVPQRLSRWQWVNLFEDDGYERLIRALQHRATSRSVLINSEDIYSIELQIKYLSRRLQKLREIQAMKGIDTEPHYLIEMEDLESKLNELKGGLTSQQTM